MKPTDDLITLFSIYMEPVFTQIQMKNKQNADLRKSRDCLLPKLMSGELEIE